MKIRNIGGLSSAELRSEILKGGKIIRYPYSISLLFTTLQRKSGGHLIRPGDNAFKKGFIFFILSALFGWWGIPDGPKHTLNSLRTIWKGGRDVTDDVNSILEGSAMFKELELEKQ